MTKVGVWKTLVEKCFPFNQGILHGNPDIIVNAGSPNGSVTAGNVGTLCWDETNSEGYIKTAAASTWVKINA